MTLGRLVPVFLGTNASDADLIPQARRPCVGRRLCDDGGAKAPISTNASKQIDFTATQHKTELNGSPTVLSTHGYDAIDAFARAAARAGTNVWTDNFMNPMSFESDVFGSAPSNETPTEQLGNDAWHLSQLQDGRCKVVADCIKPN